jgi:hypothetical protein
MIESATAVKLGYPQKAVLVGEEKEVGVPRIWVNLEVRTQRCESKKQWP